jgi:CheY-like chemotaxis protein
VEDSVDLQGLMSQLLKDEGYAVALAANGREALSLLHAMTDLPAVIILDLMMPVMDGFSFRAAQQQDEKLKSIPVVVMTADSHPEFKVDKLDVAECIRKPLDIHHLLRAIDRASSKV